MKRCEAAHWQTRWSPAAALSRLALADGRTGEALEITAEPTDIVARKGTWVWATDLGPARVAALAAADRIGEAKKLIAAFAQGYAAATRQGRGQG